MYRAYLSNCSPDETPYGAQDALRTVGAAHDDPGSAMNAVVGYHARYICDSAADYFIAGPDGEVVAFVTIPAAFESRSIQ